MRLGLHPLWLALILSGTGAPADEDPAPEPVRADLVERTGASLAQIQVTVNGPPDVISGLGVDDFRLKVHLRRIRDFQIDRYCEPETSPAASYVFYFDQPHLTLHGRQRALDIARQLIPQLLRKRDRAMVVSNARGLTTVESFTNDHASLLAALDRLEKDRTQWDFYSTEETARIARVVDVLNNDNDVRRAISVARTYQREEYWRTDKNLRRLTVILGSLSEVESPKALIYFADTLRSNPGAHYLSFFGSSVRESMGSLADKSLYGFAASGPFDLLINEAAAQGIRLHTVYAEGLVMPLDNVRPDLSAANRTGTVSHSSRIRFRDAQNTLASMSSETGGRSFLRGAGASRISERILEERSCLYSLSFDPAGFPQDQPLRVVLETGREGVQLRSAGRILLKSPSARLTSRLLNAFTQRAGSESNVGLRAGLVATDFRDGSYRALLQISVPGTAVPGASWDLGASLLARDEIRDEVSGTLSVGRPGVPLILEREVRLRPGPHEIVAVAHERTTGFVLSEHLQISWPDPNDQPVTCGPIALLQPIAGAFVRAGETRTSGSLARSDTDPVRPDLPVALMGLVCGRRRHKGLLRVERSLIGATTVEFPLVQFRLEGERCAQVRDLIPAGMLGPGGYRYELRILKDGKVLDEASRDFAVGD